MNDRFKFRGMTLGGEWVYGNLAIINEKIKFFGMTIGAGYYISNKVGMPFAYPVRPETVGQCTGLKDKNGKLIYEGDVLKLIDQGIEYEVSVYWESGMYCFAITSNSANLVFSDLSDNETTCEIIGNIHTENINDM